MDIVDNDIKSLIFENTSRLKDGIVLKDLVQNNSAEFTLDVTENITDELNSLELESGILDEFSSFNGTDDFKDVLGDQSKIPFDQLKEKMTNVSDDGEINKMILRHGCGEVVPSDAVVYFHYNCYLEMQDIPFDSSYQRGKPLHIQMGIGALYPGFELSILSMKHKEISRFLVSPKFAFGDMGCPPRIPPSATLMLEIELLKIIDSKEISIIDAPLEERDSFVKISSKAKEYHAFGNNYYAKGDVFAAVNKYKKAENILLSCKMSCDKEEALCRKLLFKIYTNLCVCYNHPKFNSPERVCLAAKEAFYISPEKAAKTAKLYFHLGKAQLTFQNFEKANKYLKQALSLEPDNKDITTLIAELEKKRKKYYEHERLSYQKAFQPQKLTSKDVEPSINFEETFRNQLEEITKNKIHKIKLPGDLTSKEKKLCRDISEENGLYYQEIMIGGKQFLSVERKD